MVLKGKKVILVIYIGYPLYAGGIWEGAFLVEDMEEQRNLHAQEPLVRRLTEGGSHVEERRIRTSFRRWIKQLAQGDQVHTARREEHSDVLQENTDGSYPSDQQLTYDIEVFPRIIIYGHSFQARVHLYVPNERSFRNTTQAKRRRQADE